MSYFRELRINWRSLVAAAVGLGGGLALKAYTTSLFAPHLLREFGWSKADFALIGMTSVVTAICVPIAGRLTDLIGVRRTATFGVIGIPLCFLACSAMSGSIVEYFAIYTLTTLFGVTTTSAVYSRLVAERFENARGLALAIVVSGPATVAAIGSPVLTDIIGTHGWRTGFQAMAIFSGVLGATALILIPRRLTGEVHAMKAPQRRARKDYSLIAVSSAFWVIVIGMFLCNIAQVLPSSQLMLILLDKGVSSATAAVMISAYAVGIIVGRFACGLALDRMPAHIVAAVSMGLPGIGLFILASSADATFAVAASIVLMGLSQGAEGDLVAYLVVRHFSIELYSSVLGLVVGALALATVLGSLLLSVTLKLSGSFSAFLFLSAAAVLIGSGLFMLLGRPSIARMTVQLQQA